jgi:predicted DsbA family dithiol-disulfide isomerase
MIIDVFSDSICPWCFIGKRRLERALAERGGARPVVRWRAFQLNPDMPPRGMDRQHYLSRKFDGPGNAEVVYSRIRKAGLEDDIAFNFQAIERTPNTVQSHRLIRYAGGFERQSEVVEALFEAYFFEGRDIGDDEVLAEVAEDCALDPSQVRAFLASKDMVAEVLAEDMAARKAGINGVPCFIFNGRNVLAGAQPPEVLARMLDLAMAEVEE